MKPTPVCLYDTTLRDGAQGKGISFSPGGKLKVAKALDAFGIDLIEGGYAASNPKDVAFFTDVKRLELKHARIAAFGSTRRAKLSPSDDAGCAALLAADTPVCTIFGKSWTLHVTEVLRTTEAENLAMIADTVDWLRQHDREVVYDAEHFFDGYKDNPEYALRTLAAARDAGASVLVLCDTNGGTLPHEVYEITAAVEKALDFPIGIHAHNDGGCGVANSLEAIRAGAVHLQGTINGYGERCGNADLVPVIANLKLKLGAEFAAKLPMEKLTELSMAVHELANQRPNPKAPYVGDHAFAHKAGMHVDGVRKVAHSFEHVPPESVGNGRHVLISELAGGSNVLLKILDMGVQVDKSSPEVRNVLKELERLEKEGYEFEGADASFHMLVQKVLKSHRSFFETEGYRIINEHRQKDGETVAEASVKIRVGEETEYTVAEGDGPVDALDKALRKALARFFPAIAEVRLTDFRVRILDPEQSTRAKTRVLIESTDGHRTWNTVGVSENLIEASWEALVESVEYKLFLDESDTADTDV
ncbi:MAG: citramalate synthase [Verrucomicrobia bacterium]|nr:citramalate synthase [Verrucomicrobiota bacterium]MCH8510728.1 citramalate synthase [Kiritimatiellia bacterium]